MDLNEQAAQAISNLLESSFPDTDEEVLSFARQAWLIGYGAGLDFMRDATKTAFARLHEAS